LGMTCQICGSDKKGTFVMDGIYYHSDHDCKMTLHKKLTIALAALKTVEEHEHLEDEFTEQCGDPLMGDEQYDLGTYSGHRCAAAICRKAREEIEKL
jgi:hypothetical protein